MSRRVALRAGLLAGLCVVLVAATSTAGQRSGDGDAQIVAALQELETTVQRQAESAYNGHWRVVRLVQEQQRTFLKASHHYPEFVEVGTRTWEGLIEWHVREQFPLNVARGADGRYRMNFMFSTVLLRPDLDDNYVGFPYDGERAPR